jgi:hypothetical protein
LARQRKSYLTIGLLPIDPPDPELDRDFYQPPPRLEMAQHSLLQPDAGHPLALAWGWLAPLTYQRQPRSTSGVSPEYFRTRLVDEPARWGANLIEFYPPEMDAGFPFEWSASDPFKPAEAYFGAGFDANWPAAEVLKFTEYAHAKGMLIQTFFHPAPVKRDIPQRVEDYRTISQWFWRDFSNPLLTGWQRAWDGFGYEGWFRDYDGSMNDSLWRYNPGTYLYSTAVRPAPLPNFAACIMAARGRWGNACGVSEGWRHNFFPPLYQSYQADCRVKKPSLTEWGPHWGNFGGGSYPDWIVKQVNDFVRIRADSSSVIWWLGEPAASLPEAYRAYVYGSCLDPIRSAASYQLLATGQGGYRDVVRHMTPTQAEGFGAEYAWPYESFIIANNWLWLWRNPAGDGGELLTDRSGAAHFTGQPDQNSNLRMLSPHFLESRIEGTLGAERPWLRFQLGQNDGSNKEFAAAGGFPREYQLDLTPGDSPGLASKFPARIGYEQEPAWPSRITLLFSAEAGSYELTLNHLPTDQESLLEIYLDDEIIGTFAVYAGKPASIERFPLTITPAGLHRLAIATLKGSGCAFDAIRCERTSSAFMAHRIITPIGYQAELEETLFRKLQPLGPGQGEQEYRETRRYTLRADGPFLAVDVARSYQGPARSSETFLGFPEYDRLQAGGREFQTGVMFEANDLPPFWVLQNTRQTGTDLVLILEFLTKASGGDYKLKWEPGRGLTLLSRVNGPDHYRLGLLVPHKLYQAADYPAIGDIIFRSQLVSSGPNSAPLIVNNPLPLPRLMLVELNQAQSSSWLVRENEPLTGRSWWWSRGAQVLPDLAAGASTAFPAALNTTARADGLSPMESDATLARPIHAYLKVALQARSQAEIIPAGFIADLVKPGWGCQYALAIGDVTSNAFTVRVIQESPFLFAPRVSLKTPLQSVTIDEKPWFYYDEHELFLPPRKGDYRVTINAASGPCPPHVTRTYAELSDFTWDQAHAILAFNAGHPVHFRRQLPEKSRYTALIQHVGYELRQVEGGQVVAESELMLKSEADRQRMQQNGSVIRFDPGRLLLHFTPKP